MNCIQSYTLLKKHSVEKLAMPAGQPKIDQ